MCKKDSPTDFGLVVDSVDAAAPSGTLSWNTQKPAAQQTHWVRSLEDLTASQSRPADIFTTAGVPDAVRPFMSVWPFALIVNFRITGMKSAHLCGRRRDDRTQPSLERFSTRRTSPPAETGSICRRTPFIAGGNTKSKSLCCGRGQPFARFSRTLQRGQSGSSQASLTDLSTTKTFPALDGGPGDHDFDDSETDVAIPDDDDIFSLASCTCESM